MFFIAKKYYYGVSIDISEIDLCKKTSHIPNFSKERDLFKNANIVKSHLGVILNERVLIFDSPAGLMATRAETGKRIYNIGSPYM